MLALVAGQIGSFVGGLLISLLSGEELQLQLSGIIGSLIGALVDTVVSPPQQGISRLIDDA
jgi:uncharacterized membrane protein YeaQ/YmgE (transglycosylase-associated protein family)